MWTKRTPDEIAELRAQQKRRGLKWAFAVGPPMLLLATFTNLRYIPGRESWLVPRDEIPWRLLLAVPLSIGGAVHAYWLKGRGRRMMVCPKCEAVKYADSVSACACGGTFEDVDTMKWE